MKSKHVRSLASAVLVGGLLLSGCQQDPGTAATVGGSTIEAADVDLLSNAMCEERKKLAEQGHSAAAPRSTARDEALLSLIRAQLAEDFVAGTAGLDNLPLNMSQANQLSDQVAEQARSIDDEDRPRLRELIRALLVEQQQMMAVGTSAFEAKGQPAPEDPGTLIEAGRQQLLAAEELAEVEVNPRFATPAMESVGAASAALSVPVSKTATAAAGDGEPSTDGLPANLRCG